jgi:hypothetical protein
MKLIVKLRFKISLFFKILIFLGCIRDGSIIQDGAFALREYFHSGHGALVDRPA